MCRIWQNKKSNDISPEGLRKGLRNKLYRNVTNVGLNGGEPTLRKDLGQIAAVLFEELPRLRTISLITNAYNDKEVIARIGDVGSVVKRFGGKLDVMVSLDGFGEMHDRVRGKPGNFEHAKRVTDFIKSSPLVHNVRIGCTIIKENVFGLADLLEYCQSEMLYIKFRLGIPHPRLYVQDLSEPFALNEAERYHVAEFLEGLIAHYEQNPQQRLTYRSLIDQLIFHSPRKAGCDWQHRGATITSKGELLYCAVQSRSLGNIQESDSNQLYFGNVGHLKEILATKCNDCMHDYTGIPSRKYQLRQIYDSLAGRSAFLASARQRYHASPLFRLVEGRYYHARVAKFVSMESTSSPKRGEGDDRPHILVCGWYGTETLGDKAILAGVLYAIRSAIGSVRISIASLHPYVTKMTRKQMPELADCEILSIEEAIRQIPACHLIVFGGGPLMAINSMAEIDAIFSIAQKAGIPQFIAGAGVGPLGREWIDASIRKVLSHASLRIYRDTESRIKAESLGIDTSIDDCAEDPAFTWLFNVRDSVRARPMDGRRVLILGLRDFPFAEYAAGLGKAQGQAMQAAFESAVLTALQRLAVKHPNLLIRPLPMCTNHFGGDDRWFYRRLLRGDTSLEAHLDLSLLGAELSPIEYCEAFRSGHVALTMRFHALVFALGLEVPAVAIDYTLGKGKVRALAERFDVPFQDLSSITSDFMFEALDGLLSAPKQQLSGFAPAFSSLVQSRLPRLIGHDAVKPGAEA